MFAMSTGKIRMLVYFMLKDCDGSYELIDLGLMPQPTGIIKKAA